MLLKAVFAVFASFSGRAINNFENLTEQLDSWVDSWLISNWVFTTLAINTFTAFITFFFPKSRVHCHNFLSFSLTRNKFPVSYFLSFFLFFLQLFLSSILCYKYGRWFLSLPNSVKHYKSSKAPSSCLAWSRPICESSVKTGRCVKLLLTKTSIINKKLLFHRVKGGV